MALLSRFLPKRKPPEIKNNIPKEKNTIRKTFGVHCRSRHGSPEGKLCPRCTALLATVMTKMDRCPYGITKPICDRCEQPCFGASQTQEFLEIMRGSQKKMLLSHPILAIKHKLASMGVDYSKYRQQKQQDDRAKAKAKAKEKAAAERKEAKDAPSVPAAEPAAGKEKRGKKRKKK